MSVCNQTDTIGQEACPMKNSEVRMKPNELITAKELSKRLNVPVSWVYRRTRLGQEAIPHVRMGKYVRFDWEAVVEFYKDGLQP